MLAGPARVLVDRHGAILASIHRWQSVWLGVASIAWCGAGFGGRASR
jgi:hypothetical protein